MVLMARKSHRWSKPRLLRGHAGLFLLFLSLLCTQGCMQHRLSRESSASRRDINAVISDHDRELLALPGVVGVYVGLLDDDKTPCLKVMVKTKDPDLVRRIPQRIEGHPVVIEVTGEIRPFR